MQSVVKKFIASCAFAMLSLPLTAEIPKQAVDIAALSVAKEIELPTGIPECSADRKMVFAHYVPWHNCYNNQLRAKDYHEYSVINDNTLVESAKREIALAMATGIDGFFFDIGSQFESHQADAFFQAAKGTPFLIGFCLDIRPKQGEEGIQLSVDSLEYLYKNYGSHPNYPMVDGKMVFFSFTGSTRHTPDKIREIRKRLKAKGIEVYYILDRENQEWRNNFSNMLANQYDDPFAPVSDSFYQFMTSTMAWNPAGENEQIHRESFLCLKNALAKYGKKPVICITPGYRGNWLGQGGHSGYVPFNGYDKMWECFHAFREGEANWINLSTWNDLGETPVYPRLFDYGATSELFRALTDWIFKKLPPPVQSEPRLYFAAFREVLVGTTIRLSMISAPVANGEMITLSGRLLDNNGKVIGALPEKQFRLYQFARQEWMIPTANLAETHAVTPEITATWTIAGKTQTQTNPLQAVLLRTPWLQNWSTAKTAFHNTIRIPCELTVAQKENLVTAKLKFSTREKVIRAMLFRNDRMVAEFTPEQNVKYLNLRISPRHKQGNFEFKVLNGKITSLKRSYGFTDSIDKIKWDAQSLRLGHEHGEYGTQIACSDQTVMEAYFNGKLVGKTTPDELVRERSVTLGAEDKCELVFSDWNEFSSLPKQNLESEKTYQVSFYSRTLRPSDIYHVNFITDKGQNAYSRYELPFGKEKLVRMRLLLTNIHQDSRKFNFGYYNKTIKPISTPMLMTVNSACLREGEWNFNHAEEDSLGDRPIIRELYNANAYNLPDRVLKPQGPDGSNCLVLGPQDELRLRRKVVPAGNCVIEFNMKVDKFPERNMNFMRATGGSENGGLVFCLNKDGKLQVGRYGTNNRLLATVPIRKSQWESIRFTFDEVTASLYVNGKPAGEAQFSPMRYLDSREFTIGNQKDGFEGQFDDIRFSNFTIPVKKD